jgi:aerobic-type carbon monoxide dehydrogenase small subunit (CoxS/CutS family)
MAEEQKEHLSRISRREFLKDAGLIVGGATVGSMAMMSACGGDSETTKTVTSTSTVTKTVGGTTTVTVTANTPGESGLAPLNITVNGQHYSINIRPEWTLQHLLHDELGWTDVKDMCVGYGACGACTVILEGRPVLSCMALAAECDGMNVQTAQGIAHEAHPVVDSYTKYLTFQCGYCTPGFVVTAKALLDAKPNPTDADIIEALGGNICRCGTYPAHILAIKDAASKLAGGA